MHTSLALLRSLHWGAKQVKSTSQGCHWKMSGLTRWLNWIMLTCCKAPYWNLKLSITWFPPFPAFWDIFELSLMLESVQYYRLFVFDQNSQSIWCRMVWQQAGFCHQLIFFYHTHVLFYAVYTQTRSWTYLVIQSETMINSSRKNDQITFFNKDADPPVIIIPYVKVATAVHNKPYFLISMKMLFKKWLDLHKICNKQQFVSI